MEDLKVFTTVEALRERLDLIDKNDTVGLLPTMGALHHGHLSLVSQAFDKADVVVVSIFVNPTQFNNSEDLTNYPRRLDEDVKLLQTIGDVIVFAPKESEIYPEGYEPIQLELGVLDEVMEGEFRPGHFNGVVNVVKRLFDIISPNYSFFGLKDFQQLAVIKFMVEELEVPVQIVGCEIVREESGLASSSRNMRLSESEKDTAKIIFEALRWAKFIAKHQSPEEVIEVVIDMINHEGLRVEYFQIVDPKTLLPVNDWIPGAHACVVAYCGEVRLLDNLQLTDS